MSILGALLAILIGFFATNIINTVGKSAITAFFNFKKMQLGWQQYIAEKRTQLAALERDASVLKGQPVEFKVRYPIAFHTVDAAVTRTVGDDIEVLLIQKPAEVETGMWRFPGGFVDPTDKSAEAAAKREATEEVGGMETDTPQYIGSMKIDDPRYRTSVHKIITSFFELPYLWGAEKAGDDAAKASWKKLSELKSNPAMRNPIHEELFQALFTRKAN